MQAAFDRTTLDRLIALGKSRGGLTPDDLRRALPVDRMSAEDIALVLIELEEAGISVDPDEIVMTSGGRSHPPARSGCRSRGRPRRLRPPPHRRRPRRLQARRRSAPRRPRSPRAARTGRWCGRAWRRSSSCSSCWLCGGAGVSGRPLNRPTRDLILRC